jgi:formate hydrogenlyase subunit 3/multisubunit Na+/H+ antiporter MnhD subunit
VIAIGLPPLVLFVGALTCLGLARRPVWARRAGVTTALVGAAAGWGPAWTALFAGQSLTERWAWPLPMGSVALRLDPLAAVFVLPVLVLTALAAVYGSEYFAGSDAASHGGAAKPDLTWFWYNALTGSMVLAILAADAMLFLLAWEAMSLASFFLVVHEPDRPQVRHAGWLYLVATHVGAAFLLALFALLGDRAGSLDYLSLSRLTLSPVTCAVAFGLAVLGFGTKAGFVPLHVWLPEAHPAAPSPVSAVMSGVMIKTGLYGLLRILTFLGPPPAWWGWCLIIVGSVSGVLGVVFALAQHDVKRLLAYHSVENVGIITVGIGVGLLGVAYHWPLLAFLGLAGGLFHVVNHALFKGLLFLGAGAAARQAGTREIDRLGGLLRRMPVTGATFIIGSVAICGLPPLNGFVSELLVYLGAFHLLVGDSAVPVAGAVIGVAAAAALALIGGLALACFGKACGIVFLGEPRSGAAAAAVEVGPAMRWPMLILAATCLAVALAAPWLLPGLGHAAAVVVTPLSPTSDGAAAVTVAASWAAGPVAMAATASASLLVLCLALVGCRCAMLRWRPVGRAVTWDCGYAAPNPRMQYTASSFADPLNRLFGGVLRTRRRLVPPVGLFPTSASFASDTPDVSRERLFGPGFARFEAGVAHLRWLQHGRLNLYILAIVAALVVALAWAAR